MLLPFPPAVRGGGGTVADDVLDYQGSRLVSPEVDPNTANLKGGLDQHAAELGKISLRQKKPDLGMSSILNSHRTCPQLPNWSRRAFYDSQHYTPEDAKVKISGGM